ncbi:MAG TPA: hypothetical protein VE338_15335, partial [Ktedonobacterales bacterium]|nr:hypothetical protein [Ktedonobacterales bacterium]
MSAPHLEHTPTAAEATTPETTTARSQEQPQPSAPVAPELPTGDDGLTAGQALSLWWNKSVPRGARTAVTQLAIALAVVLVVLPLASALGWFGLHTAAPSSARASMPSQATTASGNSPS